MILSSLLGVFLCPVFSGGFLPDRADPDPLPGPDAECDHPELALHPWLAATVSRPVFARRTPAARPAAAPEAPAYDVMTEFERLGENMRDSVAAPPSLERFLREIQDQNIRGRAAAVGVFAYPGNFAAIPYVSAVLFRVDEQPVVRVAAAEGLGRIGDPRAWRFLARALDDPDARVRYAAAAALIRVAAALSRGRRAFELARKGGLEETVSLYRPLRDSRPLVRAAAALALARAPSAAGVVLLEAALDTEKDRSVRTVLSWALPRARS
ncbi:MAG: HEAT repeat domain-containing protein [Elusimicrobia bacterium]|nr:HEAT repeat domain-containing protein [Elusimicrobiota bacterium]